MADDFYPFVDSGDPAPDNSHINGVHELPHEAAAAPAGDAAPAGGAPSSSALVDAAAAAGEVAAYATRISIYDDMLSTPRVVVIEAGPVRTYLEEVTNTVYRCMKEQGGNISLMVIREIVENFIHAHFVEPIISILDGGNTIRFADQGPGINDKERAFEFGVTSANRGMKRYIRGTGAGFPMVQQYLEAAGGAVSIEDNLGAGTVVTVSIDPARVEQMKESSNRGAAVRASAFDTSLPARGASRVGAGVGAVGGMATDPASPAAVGAPHQSAPWMDDPAQHTAAPQPYAPGMGYPQQAAGYQQTGWYGYGYGYPPAGYPQQPAGYPAVPPAAEQNGYQQPGYPGTAPWGAPDSGVPGQTMPGMPAVPGMMPGTAGAAGAVGAAGNPAAQHGAAPMGAPTSPWPSDFAISDRGQLALRFIMEQGHCGPTELATAYGQSGPTWSRELATLSRRGFVVKQGQKYYLTDLGASWINARGA